MVVFIAICCCTAYSDDSAMSIVDGGTVQPMDKHPSIRMMRETVDVKLGTRVGNEWPVFVRCQFEFHNDGPATDTNMGFPEIAQGSGDSSASGRIKSFKSWVDGQPVKIKYMPSSGNSKGEFRKRYKAWYVKKVHFDAGQSRRVVVVYSARLGFSNTASSPEGMVFLFGYILRTGANWKGLIEKAVINVDTSAAGNRYNIDALPSGYKAKKNKLTWTFKNFEPTQDIGLTFKQRFPLLNGKSVHYDIWEPCYELNGVVMAASRFLYELGGEIDLNNSICTIKYAKHILRLRSGSKTAMLDGKKIILTHAPWQEKDSDQFAVPLEEIVRLLGGSVKYDSNRIPNVRLKPR